MESLQGWLSLITSFASSVGVLFLVYNHFRNPDIKASERIDKIETSCPLKHEKQDYVIQEIQKNMKAISDSLLLLKENDIKHIELEMRELANTQTKILTILEYREGKKI